MKNYVKSLAGLSAVIFTLSNSMFLSVHGEHVRNIVILGDSVSTEQSLGSEEKSYVECLENYTNLNIQNFSQENFMTADVLECFHQQDVQEALNNADMIILAVGEHEVTDEFIETANGILETFGITDFPDIFTANLEDFGVTNEDQLISYSNQLATAIRKNQSSVEENLQLIDTELNAYTNAKIIWQNLYNPLDTIENYDQLSAKRKLAYDSILNPAKSTISSINEVIAESAQHHENCQVLDVYSEFAGKSYLYTNLSQLDANPNADGHAKISEMMISQASLSRMGDVNADNLINASDAAEVLQHAASIGAGGEGIFNDDQKIGADVNEDGIVNAIDASQILCYAAAAGAGVSYTFEKADQSELIDPDPTQPTDEPELADPDPTQPTDEPELTDPDPTQPTSEAVLTDPDPNAPVELPVI